MEMSYINAVEFYLAIKKTGIVGFANTEIGREPQGWGAGPGKTEKQGRKQRKVYFKMLWIHSIHSWDLVKN